LILKGKSPQKSFGSTNYRDQSDDFCSLRRLTARQTRLEKYRHRSNRLISIDKFTVLQFLQIDGVNGARGNDDIVWK